MKLLGIILGTLGAVIAIWTTLMLWGQNQQYQAYDHPLMKIEGPITALYINNFEEAKSFLESNPKGVLALPLRMSADGHFFTVQDQELSFIHELPKSQPEDYKGNKHFYYDYVFLKNHVPHIVSLDAWMSLKPNFWIWDIQDNAIQVDKHIIQQVESRQLQDQVIIKSDIDLVISSLKEQKPLWIYGSTLSDLNKLLTLASIHLEGIASFHRDYFFSPLTLQNRDMINPSVLSEMRKRHKKIVLGPVHTDLDRERALSLDPDITLVEKNILR